MTDTTIRVLLIEDNIPQAQVIEKLLALSRQVTFEVVIESTLYDALRNLAERQYDVVLVDLYLADSYGSDTIQRVQAQAPETPIVVLTNIDEEMMAIRSAEMGVQDYLVKTRLTSPVLVRSIRFAKIRHGLFKEMKTHCEQRIHDLERQLAART